MTALTTRPLTGLQRSYVAKLYVMNSLMRASLTDGERAIYDRLCARGLAEIRIIEGASRYALTEKGRALATTR